MLEFLLIWIKCILEFHAVYVCLYTYVSYAACIYEMCLKSIGTVCFAQTTLATVVKALFFKMAQCFVVVKM